MLIVKEAMSVGGQGVYGNLVFVLLLLNEHKTSLNIKSIMTSLNIKSIMKMSVFKILLGICKYVSRDSDSVGLDKFRSLCFKQAPG